MIQSQSQIQSKIYHSCAANRSWVLDEAHRHALWRGVSGKGADEGPFGDGLAGLSSRTWKPVANHSCGKFGLQLIGPPPSAEMTDDERGLGLAEGRETLVPDTWHGLVQKP